MTEEEIERIESQLSMKLPVGYRELLLSYPFAKDSFGAECMLIDDVEYLISANDDRAGTSMGPPYFLIGTDGGEEQYFLNLDSGESAVSRFDLETGKLEDFTPDLASYVGKIREADEEVAADEKLMAEIRAGAKWWEFWKKF